MTDDKTKCIGGCFLVYIEGEDVDDFIYRGKEIQEIHFASCTSSLSILETFPQIIKVGAIRGVGGVEFYKRSEEDFKKFISKKFFKNK